MCVNHPRYARPSRPGSPNSAVSTSWSPMRGYARWAKTLHVQAYFDAVNVDLVGVINTISAAYPHLSGRSVDHRNRIRRGHGEGQRRQSRRRDRAAPVTPTPSRVLRSFVHDLAHGSWHPNRSASTRCTRPTATPTCCRATPCIACSGPTSRPRPARTPRSAFPAMQPMPIGWVEPDDVSKAVAFLASDDVALRHRPAD